VFTFSVLLGLKNNARLEDYQKCLNYVIIVELIKVTNMKARNSVFF